MEKETVHNIVGKCKKCKKEIDNAVEPFFTSSEGDIYCQKCYKGQ